VAFIMLRNLAISSAWFGLPHQWPEALWPLEEDGVDALLPLRPLQRSPELTDTGWQYKQ